MLVDKFEINRMVESFLNGEGEYDESQLGLASTAKERYVLHVAKRLITAFNFYKEGTCGMGDLLGSLRNYLVTLQLSIRLDHLAIPAENQFGITFDESACEYFASFDLPPYVNPDFVKTAFQIEDYSAGEMLNAYDLSTGPFLRRLTGFKSFKTVAQKLAVCGASNAPSGSTTLISLPTGGGKSLITQVLAYQQEGLTIAIVPTVSLAIDQVRVAKQIIKSSSVDDEIFSYSSGVDPAPMIDAIEKRTARLLFISPEAVMSNKRIRNVLEKANDGRYIKGIVIDEAHIVVDWGALFRVDYQCLESWRKKLVSKNPEIRTILLSATFEEKSIDILKKLFSVPDKPWIEIRCDSLRHEPRFMYIKAKSRTDKTKKMIELVKKLPHPMVVYVSSPSEAEHYASVLRKEGIRNVKTFTGETSGIRRRELIDSWTDDRFEVMVATSAFGVGVDKSDVRTVLHLYVPQNPNAYYQELGRGGRDGLPCLSLMCVEKEDIASAFGRISKKVLTTEKITGRWCSMYRSSATKLKDGMAFVDTAVKPNYAEDDFPDDRPLSEKHKDWNIYVLLFLRRNGLIEILDILPQDGRYIFVVKVLDERLLASDIDAEKAIAPYRYEEWNTYVAGFNALKRAMRKSGTECWSEMFFSTYHRVSEYCAGCDEHDEPNNADAGEFPLKTRLSTPIKLIDQEQAAFFGSANNAIVISSEDEVDSLMRAVGKRRISTLVCMNEAKTDGYVDALGDAGNVIVMNMNLLKELVRRNSLFFLSGIVAVKYDGISSDILSSLRFLMGAFRTEPCVKLLHIINEDYYFESIDKRFSDIVDGPVKALRSIV